MEGGEGGTTKSKTEGKGTSEKTGSKGTSGWESD